MTAQRRGVLALADRFGVRVIVIGAGALLATVAFGILIGLVRTNWAPLHHLDTNTAQHLNEYLAAHHSSVGPWKFVTTVGGPLTFRLVTGGVAVLLWFRGRRRQAVFVATTMIIAAFISVTAKTLVHRSRPVLPVSIAHARGESFPSGHALASLVGVGVLLAVVYPMVDQVWRVVLTIAGVIIVAAVGFSRVILGVHYVSDVLGSWLIGGALLLIMIVTFHLGDLRAPPETAAT